MQSRNQRETPLTRRTQRFAEFNFLRGPPRPLHLCVKASAPVIFPEIGRANAKIQRRPYLQVPGRNSLPIPLPVESIHCPCRIRTARTRPHRKSNECPVKMSSAKPKLKFWTGLGDPSSARTTYTLEPASLFPARLSPIYTGRFHPQLEISRIPLMPSPIIL